MVRKVVSIVANFFLVFSSCGKEESQDSKPSAQTGPFATCTVTYLDEDGTAAGKRCIEIGRASTDDQDALQSYCDGELKDYLAQENELAPAGLGNADFSKDQCNLEGSSGGCSYPQHQESQPIPKASVDASQPITDWYYTDLPLPGGNKDQCQRSGGSWVDAS